MVELLYTIGHLFALAVVLSSFFNFSEEDLENY